LRAEEGQGKDLKTLMSQIFLRAEEGKEKD
jgi:hypothetical protein